MRADLILAMQGMNLRKGHETTQRRTSAIIDWPNKTGDAFPWEKLQFGWKPAPTAGEVTIMSGEVIKMGYSPQPVAQQDVPIGTSETYVGIWIKRDLSVILIETGTSRAEFVTDSDHVKFWFYIFIRVGGVVSMVRPNLGQLMSVDITAYGD